MAQYGLCFIDSGRIGGCCCNQLRFGGACTQVGSDKTDGVTGEEAVDIGEAGADRPVTQIINDGFGAGQGCIGGTLTNTENLSVSNGNESCKGRFSGYGKDAVGFQQNVCKFGHNKFTPNMVAAFCGSHRKRPHWFAGTVRPLLPRQERRK